MAAKRSAAEMEQLRREFLVRAEAAFEQMFGADGQTAWSPSPSGRTGPAR